MVITRQKGRAFCVCFKRQGVTPIIVTYTAGINACENDQLPVRALKKFPGHATTRRDARQTILANVHLHFLCVFQAACLMTRPW